MTNVARLMKITASGMNPLYKRSHGGPAPGATRVDKMMRKILTAPAVLAAFLLAAAPAQAQFGSLLRKVTTPAPKPGEEDNGGCPKGKKGSGIGRNILGNVINDVVGDAASKIGRASWRERVCQYVTISVVGGSLKKTKRINLYYMIQD